MFELSTYHLVLTGFGALILLSHWVPRFFSGREPASSALLMLGGVGVSFLFPDFADQLSPENSGKLWEVSTEMCVIIGLFGVGISIDRIAASSKWRPTLRLLLIVMPLMIILTAGAGMLFAGLALPIAMLLGAVLAPTDPVLARDVQIAPPGEGKEETVRFALTTEAGLNDGLAFPFVYLALALIAAGAASPSLLASWIAIDVIYRIGVGALAGAVLGKALGHIVFRLPRKNPLSESEADIVSLTGIVLTYGIAELLEGYGFIAVFVAAVLLRQEKAEHAFHGRVHDFVRALEQTLTAILLLGLGVILPNLLSEVTAGQIVVVLVLLFVLRPALGWLALWGLNIEWRERAVMAFYGIRGVGSVYYLAYAQTHGDFSEEAQSLWVITVLLIMLSTIVHGLSAGIALSRAGRSETPP